jgi:hypothetical protein
LNERVVVIAISGVKSHTVDVGDMLSVAPIQSVSLGEVYVEVGTGRCVSEPRTEGSERPLESAVETRSSHLVEPAVVSVCQTPRNPDKGLR